MQAGKRSLGLDFIGKMKVHGFFIPLSDGFIDQTRPMLPAGFSAQPMAGYLPQVKADRFYIVLRVLIGFMRVNKPFMD